MKNRIVIFGVLAAMVLLVVGCAVSRPTPPPPKPLAPANNSKVNTITPTFRVEEMKGVDQFKWTIYDEQKNVVISGTSVDPNWMAPKGTLKNEIEYPWNCMAHNSKGWGKPFLPEWKFTTDVPLPIAPIPVAPANGAEVSVRSPTLEVQGVADADEYQWLVKDTTGQEAAKGTSSGPTWTASGALANLQKYSWSAQVRNAAGWGPDFTPEWTFRVKLPPPPAPPTSALKTIHFDFDKYDIRPGDAKILEDNATYVRANAGTNFVLEGYCDPIGTEEYNRGLGLRRSNTTKSYLVKLGIDGSRFSVISFGEEKLVTTDSTQYELNRRVEFVPKQ
jgi:peptidoglycan-associated lipoprotein